MYSERYQQHIKTLVEKIEQADAIVVGGASGMSAAGGYNWYEDNAAFREHFGDFAIKYGIDSIFGGFYYRFQTLEERWAYLARLVNFVSQAPMAKPYENLFELIQNKDYYILTTNQDRQFYHVFPETKVSAIQGDWTHIQCAQRCHDQVYDFSEEAHNLCTKIIDAQIPSDDIPICPSCGGNMELWVRSFVFLEGTKYKNELEKLNEYLLMVKHKRVLFLELGVGPMTPMFIKEPFWNLTYMWPNAYYITINPKDAILPEKLENKGQAIHEDIQQVLGDSVKYRQTLENSVNL
ncbi:MULTISPECIES: NAD-dependent protein deacetylase [Staphylococcus]|uniref:NAD-dependent protein deacetylase n=1 Tax=Staphylococcus TaxID=1279 RepID=UPI000BC2C9D8|nr:MULTISPECIES: NAD-dependent protein deacetylase [Staphylococcus]ATH58949.1 hypothetical protein BJD96_00630 [Staphylococcus nepalensis]ATH64040.1 hypothetical protein BJG89_00975 [Staphylococcus nepalensis]AWI43403.1 hypothetical protein BJG88_00690 [Staphylococcus nepalensis]NWN86087.1 NAD-dependent protein deacetylase [Staphylococcus sp.]